jgi:competence protein ComEA
LIAHRGGLSLNKLKNILISIAAVLLVSVTGLLIYTYNEDTNKKARQNLVIQSNGNVNSDSSGTVSVSRQEETNVATEKTSSVIVQISGEVVNPDVYELEDGARLKDLVEKAGGFTEQAYTDNLNLAEKLKDEQKYTVWNVVKDIDKIKALEENVTEDSSDEDGLININTADAITLERLDGIGEILAGRIIEYRMSTGPFTSIEEIREVEGIGDKLYNKIKDEITIGS